MMYCAHCTPRCVTSRRTTLVQLRTPRVSCRATTGWSGSSASCHLCVASPRRATRNVPLTRGHTPPPTTTTTTRNRRICCDCAAVQDTGATINGREPSSSSNGSPKRATHASSSTQARRAPTTGGGGAGVGRESSRQSSSVSAVDGQASAGRREALELVGEMVGCIVMSVAAPSPVPQVLLWCSCAHVDAMTRHCVGQVRLVG